MNRILRSIALLPAGLVVAVCATFAEATQDKPEGVKTLEYFVGDWHCDGKFTANGKEISAKLHFEQALDGKFIVFKHDDEPPFAYHAHAYWGWDKSSGQFIATIHDSTDISVRRMERRDARMAGRRPAFRRQSTIYFRTDRGEEVPRELFVPEE